MKKCALSAFLAVCTLLGVLSFGTTVTIAAPGMEARYQTEEDGAWNFGTLSEACANVYAGGRVEVLENILLEAPIKIQTPMTLSSAEGEGPYTVSYTAETYGDFMLTVYADAVFENILLDGRREEGLTTHIELVGVQGGSRGTTHGFLFPAQNQNIETKEEMNMKTKTMKRTISMLLTLAMLLGMLPVSAAAAGGNSKISIAEYKGMSMVDPLTGQWISQFHFSPQKETMAFSSTDLKPGRTVVRLSYSLEWGQDVELSLYKLNTQDEGDGALVPHKEDDGRTWFTCAMNPLDDAEDRKSVV